MHYHSFSTHGKDDTIKALITNEEEAAKQYPTVQSFLREAMTDVLLRMHEFQQQEQTALRSDPLSVLALNAPSSTTNAASMDVSIPSKSQKKMTQTRPEVTSVNSKKLKKDFLWNTASSSSVHKDDSDEWHVSQKADLLRQVHGNTEDEYLYNSGPPCSQCKSSETIVKHDSSMSSMTGTRSEVWGNKDNEGGHSRSIVWCKSCGFEKIEVV